MRQFGAQYCECFGTKKEQRDFYNNEYYKHLWTWGAFEDQQGNIRLLLSAPPESLRAKTVRGMFKEAAKILPYEHHGGRPRSVKPKEVHRLRVEVERLAIERGGLSPALRHIAELEGMDPRTLRAAIGNISVSTPALVALRGKKKDKRTLRVLTSDDSTPLGGHYRRNAIGSFDKVS
jgi:hypothetical protein